MRLRRTIETLTPLGTSLMAVVVTLLVACLLLLITGFNPIQTLSHLFSAGWGCSGPGRCSLLTTLQFSTPLILTGLSAVVAFRAGVFSVGQSGQMLLGAALAASAGSHLASLGMIHPVMALMGGAAAGAAWAWIPGALKIYLNINEVIVTLVLNQLAVMLTGLFWLDRIPDSARFAPLAIGTKLNAGLVLAVFSVGIVTVWLSQLAPGYEQRMAGQAPSFAKYGGIQHRRAVLRAMLLSGGLAGAAGAIEVLGVHYRFVATFAGGGGFDGVAVALLGQAQPIGVLLSAMLLAGVRVGALTGLQLQAGVPRELGEAMIAMMIVFVSLGSLYQVVVSRATQWISARRARSTLYVDVIDSSQSPHR